MMFRRSEGGGKWKKERKKERRESASEREFPFLLFVLFFVVVNLENAKQNLKMITRCRVGRA